MFGFIFPYLVKKVLTVNPIAWTGGLLVTVMLWFVPGSAAVRQGRGTVPDRLGVPGCPPPDPAAHSHHQPLRQQVRTDCARSPQPAIQYLSWLGKLVYRPRVVWYVHTESTPCPLTYRRYILCMIGLYFLWCSLHSPIILCNFEEQLLLNILGRRFGVLSSWNGKPKKKYTMKNLI